MHYLILFAHPNGHGFSHKIARVVEETIQQHQHTFEFRNLYGSGFDPVLKTEDLAGFRSGAYPDDILAEQDRVRRADVLVFIYPLWWGGMPAIMKGWIDRVFSAGFAYEYNENRPVGLLSGKEALIFSSMGYSTEDYQAKGMTRAMMTVNEEGIFGFCGIRTAGQYFFGSAAGLDEEGSRVYLEEVRQAMAAPGVSGSPVRNTNTALSFA